MDSPNDFGIKRETHSQHLPCREGLWYGISTEGCHAKSSVNQQLDSKEADLLHAYRQITPEYLPQGLIRSPPAPRQQGDALCTHANATREKAGESLG